MTAHHEPRHEANLTSGDYEREAEHTRRRLAEHLDELSDRLTPGQVFDEMLTYSRAGGGTFFSAFSNALRQSPLPSLLIGAGCMMFMSEKLGLRPGNGARPMRASADDPYGTGAFQETSPVSEMAARMSEASDRAPRASGPTSAASRVSDASGRVTGAAASSARSAAASVQSGLRAAVGSVGQRTSDAADAVSDTVAGAADAVRGTAASMSGAVADTATSMGSAIADTASSMGGSIADTAARSRRQAADAVRQSRDSAASLVTEQPLLAAAIGVAIGAALASLLPRTETEDQLMGEASDAVKGTATQVGSEALESAKHVAAKVADRAQTAVREEGLSPSAVADAARNVGEGIRDGAKGVAGEAMRKVGEGPREDAQSAMKQPTAGTKPQPGASGSGHS